MGLFGASKVEKQLMQEKEMMQKEIERLRTLLLPEQQNIEMLYAHINSLNQTIEGQNSSIQYNNNIIAGQNAEILNLESAINEKTRQLSIYDVDIYALDYGIYKPTYEFANSDLYKEKLTEIRNAQKMCVKNDTAAVGNAGWTVNGSAAQGRTMVNDTKKLLLRAFNVECDDIVANVRVSNIDRSIERIYKTSEQISKLGRIMSISITRQYIDLKIQEAKMALDYQQKKQEEKELQKELRAQAREEAKVQKEIEEAKKRLAKEKNH